MAKHTEKTYVLFGYALRSGTVVPTELVCQFFETPEDRAEFARDLLPGVYGTMTLDGVHYDSFDCTDQQDWLPRQRPRRNT